MEEAEKRIKKTDSVIIVPMTTEMLSGLSMLHMRGFNGALNTRLGQGYVFACINWFFQLEGVLPWSRKITMISY